MTDAVLRVDAVRSGYGEQDILHGVSIVVPRGKIVGIIGPNGSGKSTLLKTIYGLVPARGGRILLWRAGEPERSLAGLRPHRITALGMNMVPQLANVFPDMTVRENLEVGALINRKRSAKCLETVLRAQPLVRELLPKRAATLSGGQRQMVAVARALMSEPDVLLLDEPSAGLAPMVQGEVFARVREINALGVSVLMVEQRARQCLAIADYAYVLEQGRNRLEGTGQALLRDPEVLRLYVGASRRTAAASA
ncbi:MAG TPA: ABC transporter ATP-binding protein [Acetobacteraceae bacterium]|nr:ABC transporter ATP-binding protein [Acetobacteraceae bacterium]